LVLKKAIEDKKGCFDSICQNGAVIGLTAEGKRHAQGRYRFHPLEIGKQS